MDKPDVSVIDATLAALDEQREIRSAVFQPIDAADDGSSFEGYAAVFEEDAELDIPGVGKVTEAVQRGAFRKALGHYHIPMLYHHLDTHPPLAMYRPGGGTLELEEDAKGLRVRANVARGYIGDAVRELVKRGDIPGMSWGFIAGKGNSRVERRAEGLHRTLLGFKRILDVSPTWDPTYRGTEAQFRSRAFGMAGSPYELEQILRGDRPQPEEQASQQGGELPDGEEEAAEAVEARSGATSVAARKRALELFLIETEGGYDNAS